MTLKPKGTQMYLAGLHSAKPVRERGYANDLIAPVKDVVVGGPTVQMEEVLEVDGDREREDKTSWVFDDEVTITHATLWKGERCLAIFPAPYVGWRVEAGKDIGLHLDRLDFAMRVRGEPLDFSDDEITTERVG